MPVRSSELPLSERMYAALHQLFNQVAKRAYERGYADATARRAPEPDAVKVSLHSIKQIKSL